MSLPVGLGVGSLLAHTDAGRHCIASADAWVGHPLHRRRRRLRRGHQVAAAADRSKSGPGHWLRLRRRTARLLSVAPADGRFVASVASRTAAPHVRREIWLCVWPTGRPSVAA